MPFREEAHCDTQEEIIELQEQKVQPTPEKPPVIRDEANLSNSTGGIESFRNHPQ